MDTEDFLDEIVGQLKKVSSLIKREISMIEDKGRSVGNSQPSSYEEDMMINILITQKSYLEFYNKIFNFLIDKFSDSTPEEDFFFYLPLLRTLIEIYACLLFFCFQNKTKQIALVLVQYFLATIRISGKSKKDEKDSNYRETYNHFKHFIDKEGLSIPGEVSGFSSKWLDRSGYNFPKVPNMLNSQWISMASPQFNLRIQSADLDHYYVYKALSNYVHGNIFSRQTHGNEKFWIISETWMLSIQIIELVSVKILDNSFRVEISKCIKEFINSRKRFINLWVSRNDS